MPVSRNVWAFTALLFVFFLVLSTSGCSTGRPAATLTPTQPAIERESLPPTSTAAPSVTPLPTLAPSATRSPTQEPEPPSTSTPTVTLTPSPSATRTLGPPVTRTAAPAALCPEERAETPVIIAEHPGTSVIDKFEPQILNYLNLKGSSAGLEATLSPLTLDLGGGTIWQARAQVVNRDVTGNQTPDVLVYLLFFEAGQYSEGALFIFQCENAGYVGGTVTALWGQVLSAADPDGIRAVQDLNADGVPEIVVSNIQIAGTHSYFIREFRVLEWDGNGFVELFEPAFEGDAIAADTGDGVIQDMDGDGTYELLLTNAIGAAYFDLGAQRRRTDIWAWDGYAFSLQCVQHTAPVYRFQAVHDGDNAFYCGDFESALAFYQQAIFDESLFGWSSGQLWPDSAYGGSPTPTPDLEERSRLSAYARYRIMLLHTVRDFMAEAEIVYDTLQELFPQGTPGFRYAELARIFWETYRQSGEIEAACSAVIEHAALHQLEILAPLGGDFYGLGQRAYEPADVCPIG